MPSHRSLLRETNSLGSTYNRYARNGLPIFLLQIMQFLVVLHQSVATDSILEIRKITLSRLSDTIALCAKDFF
jgi:hypothetical protein